MIKSKITAVAAALALVAGSAAAETKVVGQISASPSAVVIADSVKTNIGKTAVPYIQGDVVATSNDSSATLRLTSGKANFVVSPNTNMQVVNGDAGEIALNEGAVRVSASTGHPVSITTAAGSFEVSSDSALDAIVIVRDGEFGVVSNAGDVFVSSQEGLVSKVPAGEAFSYNGEAEVVDVAVFAPIIASLGVAGAIAAAAAAIVVIDEVADDDDDDDGSPN